VIHVLRENLNDVQDVLDDLPGHRISGVVVSSSFKQLDHRARQARVMKLLKQNLTADEFQSVGAIALLTPAEASVKAG